MIWAAWLLACVLMASEVLGLPASCDENIERNLDERSTDSHLLQESIHKVNTASSASKEGMSKVTYAVPGDTAEVESPGSGQSTILQWFAKPDRLRAVTMAVAGFGLLKLNIPPAVLLAF